MIKTRLFILSQLLIVYYMYLCFAIEEFGYPAPEDEDKGRQNANSRKPIYIPGRCKENEILYPGDLKNDWICDCNPGYIYHPSTDKCYPAYRQGPCGDGKFLILEKPKIIPECVKNSCIKDGKVLIRNKCYDMGQAGPCLFPELSYVVGVNITTLEIACVKQSVDVIVRGGFEDDDNNILNKIDINDIPVCAIGSQRCINGTCPKEIKH